MTTNGCSLYRINLSLNYPPDLLITSKFPCFCAFRGLIEKQKEVAAKVALSLCLIDFEPFNDVVCVGFVWSELSELVKREVF